MKAFLWSNQVSKEINLFEPNLEPQKVAATLKNSPKKPPEDDFFKFGQMALPGMNKLRPERVARQQVKRVLEAVLFASSVPINFSKLREVADAAYPLKPSILRDLLDELRDDYITSQRAFRLEEIAGGFALRTCQEYSRYVELLYRQKRAEKLSSAASEVLAIIAYKQPVTKAQIDTIRGVDSSGTLQNLLERQLVEPVGRLEAPGRPTLYGITQDFLKHFGLRDVRDLPKLDEI